jgi:anti-anti-sigma factor
MTGQPINPSARSGCNSVFALQTGKVVQEATRLAKSIGGRPPSAERFVLDLANVDHVGSEDLGALVGLHTKLRKAGGELTLLNVRPRVSEVLSITRLDTLLTVQRAEERTIA